MIKARFYSAILFLFLSCLSSFAQNQKELEKERKKINKEIAQINNLLFKEQKKGKNALEALDDLNQKIAVRTRLIANINAEAKLLSKKIGKNQNKIEKLEKELSILKADYASMIFRSYKSKSQQNRMLFLLSSKNFYQAYKRLEYMKQYTSFRKKQGEEIGAQTSLVEKLNDSLLFRKQIKDTLILSEKEQKDKIQSDKKTKEVLITSIKKKERKYKKEINRKIKAEKKVTKKIDKIIRDAIAKANRLALANAKPNSKLKVTKKDEFYLTPEAKILASKFEANKGKLPWPVDKGLITRRFGKQKHPTFPGITINGTGLHITTNTGNNAKAIFNGKILNIQVTSEGRKNVLIQHGNYITSYYNIDKLYVKKGDIVKTGHKIGRIFTDKVSKKTTLIFVLNKNLTKLDPASWISKR